MIRRRPILFLLGSTAALFLLVSCGKKDDTNFRLLQQLAVLGDEVRTANREIKLLRQEVGELRQRVGLTSPPAVEGAMVPGAACVGELEKCRVPEAAAAADPKSGISPRRDGPRASQPPPSDDSALPRGPS